MEHLETPSQPRDASFCYHRAVTGKPAELSGVTEPLGAHGISSLSLSEDTAKVQEKSSAKSPSSLSRMSALSTCNYSGKVSKPHLPSPQPCERLPDTVGCTFHSPPWVKSFPGGLPSVSSVLLELNTAKPRCPQGPRGTRIQGFSSLWDWGEIHTHPPPPFNHF